MVAVVTTTPYIIPFFISHAGCPHQCVFCNQREISGVRKVVTPEQVSLEIQAVLARPRNKKRKVQVAFYGGSFTGLDPAEQKQLLGTVQPFLHSGQVQDIRLSTRPDCLDTTRVQLLLDYGVSMVELGVQSLDPEVLEASGRGHDAYCVAEAFSLLHRYGLQVGGQLMTGLPCDTPKKCINTCKELIGYQPDCVRIYPTVVMLHTRLHHLYQVGSFQPWSLDKTVVVVAQMKQLLDNARIPVIRMGLQSGESLRANLVAGPYHPAFGELVLSRLFFRKVRRTIFQARGASLKKLQLMISSRDRSLLMGVNKENFTRLQQEGWLLNVEICLSDEQMRFEVECL